MRRFLFCLCALLSLGMLPSTQAATGRVIKVLPQFLDLEGHHAISPSLYDRDAYQFYLREHPDKRSGMRFALQWKVKGGVFEPLTLRVELRGPPQESSAKELVLETQVLPGNRFSQWTSLVLEGDAFRQFGEVTAWRATLWEGKQLLSEQESFLW